MRLKMLHPDNPIIRAGIVHQQRTIPRWLQWFDRIGVIVVALVASAAVVYVPITKDIYGTSWMPWPHFASGLLPVLWIGQLLVILRCLLAGFNTVRYPHTNQWDMLALTGLSQWKMFMGQCWAVLYQLRGWLVAWGILKLAAVLVIILNIVVFAYRSPLDSIIQSIDYYSHGPRPYLELAFQDLPMMIPALPSGAQLAILTGCAVATAVLEVMASTAVGVAGGLVPHKMIGFAGMLVVRFAPAILYAVSPMNNPTGQLAWRWYDYIGFSLADGGSTGIFSAGFSSRVLPKTAGSLETALVALYAALALYAAYLLFAVLISMVLLRRHGLLPVGAK